MGRGRDIYCLGCGSRDCRLKCRALSASVNLNRSLVTRPRLSVWSSFVERRGCELSRDARLVVERAGRVWYDLLEESILVLESGFCVLASRIQEAQASFLVRPLASILESLGHVNECHGFMVIARVVLPRPVDIDRTTRCSRSDKSCHGQEDC